jgi:hypothetical protein
MVEATELKFMASRLNSMKIYQLVKKVETHKQTNIQEAW